MNLNELHAQIEKERAAEQQAAIALAMQQGRIAGLQEALKIVGVVPIPRASQQPDPYCVPAKPVAPEQSKLTQSNPAKPAKPAIPLGMTDKEKTKRGRQRQERRRCMAEALADGPLGPGELARKCGIPEGSIHSLLGHPTFQRQIDGRWALASASAIGEPVQTAEVKPTPKPIPEPTVPESKPISENTRAYRRHKIAQTLSGGSSPLADLARKLDLSYDDVLAIVQDDPWFSQDSLGRWHITPQCRNEFFDE